MSKFIKLTEEQETELKTLAIQTLGIPYKLGAEVKLDKNLEPKDIKEIDCSELIEYLFHKIGIKIPDGSYNQYNATGEFQGETKIGDLLFMRNKASKQIGHVGIYIGKNSVVDANGYYGKTICRDIQHFSKETKNNIYAGMRRIIKEA